jgi:hypothetical protein
MRRRLSRPVSGPPADQRLPLIPDTPHGPYPAARHWRNVVGRLPYGGVRSARRGVRACGGGCNRGPGNLRPGRRRRPGRRARALSAVLAPPGYRSLTLLRARQVRRYVRAGEQRLNGEQVAALARMLAEVLPPYDPPFTALHSGPCDEPQSRNLSQVTKGDRSMLDHRVSARAFEDESRARDPDNATWGVSAGRNGSESSNSRCNARCLR